MNSGNSEILLTDTAAKGRIEGFSELRECIAFPPEAGARSAV
jgi:hypothetical protein